MPAELVREAARDGRRVVYLRCYDGEGGQTIVDGLVNPVNGGEPVMRGPYRFASAAEGFRFIQEALLALQYLGCQIS